MSENKKLNFYVRSQWINHQESISFCESKGKSAKIKLDTNLEGNKKAFNPAELLLAAISACIIKGIERVAQILKFSYSDIEVKIHGVRQDIPPKMESIQYEIIIDTDENDERLELLHRNVKQYGTVFNTIAMGTTIVGQLVRLKKL